MAKYQLIINGENREVEAVPNTPLLWVLRDNLGLTGTKYGCGWLSAEPAPFTSMALQFVRAPPLSRQ